MPPFDQVSVHRHKVRALHCGKTLLVYRIGYGLGYWLGPNQYPNPNLYPNEVLSQYSGEPFSNPVLIQYQHKLIKMRAELVNVNHCAVPFLAAPPSIWACTI